MGGDISADSSLDEGATFTVQLPMEHVGHAPALPEVGRPLGVGDDTPQIRLLVAEDNRANQLVIDTQMPEMDGPTATSIIRRRELDNGQARTPILALTANAMDHQLHEYRQAGMDGLIAKPIEIAKLFAAISHAIAPGKVTEPASR